MLAHLSETLHRQHGVIFGNPKPTGQSQQLFLVPHQEDQKTCRVVQSKLDKSLRLLKAPTGNVGASITKGSGGSLL